MLIGVDRTMPPNPESPTGRRNLFGARAAGDGHRRIAYAGLYVSVAVASLLWFPRASTRAIVGYDDGVYLSSVLAMREGGAPYRDVFSSQGPVFLPLLRLADLIGGGTPWAARVVGMVAGLALIVVVFHLARRLCDAWGAGLAAGLVATSGLLLFSTVRVESDAVVAALGGAAVLAATSSRRRWSIASVVLIGLAVGVKSLMAGPAMLAVLLLLGRRYGVRAVGAAVAGAAAIVLVVSLPWGLADVWDQSVALHLHARNREFDLVDRLRYLAETVWRSDRLIVGLGAAGAVAWVVRRRSPDRPDADESDVVRAVWLWMAATALLLCFQSPIWPQHLTALTAPAALLVARYRPPLAVIAALGLVLLPFHAYGADWRIRQLQANPSQQAIVELMAGIEPADGLVITDEPTLGWLAGRASPGFLVDTSIVRIESGGLTTAQVAAAANDPAVCAVLFWSGNLDRLDDLRAALEGYRSAFRDGDRELMLSDRCRLGSASP